MAGEDFPVLDGEGPEESSQTGLFLFLWGIFLFSTWRPLQMLFLLLEHSSSIFLLAQLVKHPPAMQETRVQSLGWEDPLEKEMSTPLQNSCLGNPMDKGAWQAAVHGVTSVGHELVTKPPPIPVTFSRKAPQTVVSLGSPHMLPLNLESPLQFSSIQSFSCVQLFATPWTAAC